MPRSSLIRTGLIALIAPICCLPAGQAQALTFTRDPAFDGWTMVGSTDQGTPTMGGWSSGSTTTNFDVYRTSFVLSGADIVTAPASGTPRGDAFLLGNSSGVCPTGATCNAGTSWLANDKIVGLGVKMRSQLSGAPNSNFFFVSVQPSAKDDFKWSYGTKSTTVGQDSFNAGGGQNGASQGSFRNQFRH
jgi:hypothetical protein